MSSISKLIKSIAKSADDITPSNNISPLARGANETFKKTKKAYKLFVQKDGKLYPLFVNAADEVPQGEFLEADFPDIAFKGTTAGGTEGFYVPTKGAAREPTRYYDAEGLEITKKEYNSLGSNQKRFARVVKGEQAKKTGDEIIIPDEETRQKLIDAGYITERSGRTKKAPFGKIIAVAARPGWHSSVNPVAEHLGPQDLKITKTEAKKLLKEGINPKAIRTRGDQYYVKRRAEDHVWAEVDMADDTSDELLEYMAQTGRTDINDKVPVGGSYSYQDGQADGDTWIVGGNMRVNKILTREEAKIKQQELGVKDLPFRDEVEAILGRKFAEGGLVGEENMYKGEQDYLTTASSGVDMNKGGTPRLEEQMELFNEGGLKDEGGEVDPESGNDVPIGSTKKEVRDDIPAMLSEGEFVFPADVVRYIGLEKLMELRQAAKMGLKKMEAMGQMGNSEEATIPDDMPFNMADLIIVSGEPKENKPREMAQGGVIRAQTGTFVPNTGIAGQRESYFANQQSTTTPSFVPPSSVAPPPPPPSPSTGYLPKFVTQAPNYSAPVVDGVTGMTAGTGTSTGTATSTSTTDTKFLSTVDDVYTQKKYINPETGETRTINFYNNSPVNEIPEGFIPFEDYTPDETTTTDLESTSVETTQVRDDKSGTKQRLEDMVRQQSSNKLSDLKRDKDPEAIKAAYLDNEKTKAFMTSIGIANPVAALAGRSAAGLYGKQLENLMEELGIEKPEIETGFFENLKGAVSDMFAGAGDQPETYQPIFKPENSPLSTVSGATNMLSMDEAKAYDNAVKSGDANVAEHYEIINNRLNKMSDYMAAGGKEGGAPTSGLSTYDIKQAEKQFEKGTGAKLGDSVNEAEAAKKARDDRKKYQKEQREKAKDKIREANKKIFTKDQGTKAAELGWDE